MIKTLIICGCSKAKAVDDPRRLTPRDFLSETSRSQREGELCRISRDYRRRAYEMYTGRFYGTTNNHFFKNGYADFLNKFRASGGVKSIDIRIVSAGYGLCEIDTHIFPYDVTYLGGYSNFDVVRRETGFHTKLEWGNHLNTRKNLDKIIGKYDLILVFLSNNYLEAINLIDSRTSKAKPFKLKEKAQVIFFNKNCVCPNDANCRTFIINKKLVENYNQKDDKLTGCNLTSIRGRVAYKIFQYSIKCGDEKDPMKIVHDNCDKLFDKLRR